MALGGGNGGTWDGGVPIAEINITPLTDVMLVLLIIAMVAAPALVYKGASLNLPKVQKVQQFEEKDSLVQVSAEGTYTYKDAPHDLDGLLSALGPTIEAAGDEPLTLLIAADPAVPYQKVLDLWNGATELGIERVVLVGDVVDAKTGASLLDSDDAPTDPEAAAADAEDA